MKQESKRWLSRALIVAALLGVGVLVWQVSRPTGLGEDSPAATGRIEATEVDVAAKLPGRSPRSRSTRATSSRPAKSSRGWIPRCSRRSWPRPRPRCARRRTPSSPRPRWCPAREREEHRPGRGGAAPGRADSGAEALHPYRGWSSAMPCRNSNSTTIGRPCRAPRRRCPRHARK